MIDAHQHAFWHGGDDAYLVANLDEQGIDKAMLLTWLVGETDRPTFGELAFNPVHARPDRPHPGLPLADAVTALRRYPDRFLLGYCPHPLDPYAIQMMDEAIRMYGAKVCGEWKFRIALDDPRCIELFRYCGEKGLAVQLHIDVPWRRDPETGTMRYVVDWYGGTIDNLERAIQACPDTIFCGHGPGFWREISADAQKVWDPYPKGRVVKGGKVARLLDQYKTLWLDCSGGSGCNALQRDLEHAKSFVLAYHERMLFARDTYDGNLHTVLQSLDLPQDVTDNIYHRNAERLYRIQK
jgi:predicted TIM-barrel fold metal-dependent hydrolase